MICSIYAKTPPNNRRGLPLAADKLLDYAHNKGWLVNGIYIDSNGCTQPSIAINGLLEEVNSGEIDAILTDSYNHFTTPYSRSSNFTKAMLDNDTLILVLNPNDSSNLAIPKVIDSRLLHFLSFGSYLKEKAALSTPSPTTQKHLLQLQQEDNHHE